MNLIKAKLFKEDDSAKFYAMLSELQNANIIQSSWHYFDEMIPKDIYDKYFAGANYKIVAEYILPEYDYNYETSVFVVKIFNHFLGVRTIDNIYEENCDFKDLGYKIEFFEMEEYLKPSYRKKQ